MQAIDRGEDIRRFMKITEAVTADPADKVIAEIKALHLPARITLYKLDATMIEATDLEARPTGQGQGRAMMVALLDAADRHGVTLECMSCPDDDVDGSLDRDTLYKWHRRLGFDHIPNRNPDDDREMDEYLVRPPKPTA